MKVANKSLPTTASAFALVLLGFTNLAQAQTDAVDVEIIDREGNRIGTAQLTRAEEGVRVQVDASGLSPGKHGLHIHARGACEPGTFESAGPHYQPEAGDHGFLNEEGPHSGDLPELNADENGEVKDYDITTNRVELHENSLLHSQGTALLIHAEADDYLTGTGGGSGDRIACGVIRAGG
ncbi:MAG: superoxide dismutase family protein [Pseudohongiellaceae bacterium]